MSPSIRFALWVGLMIASIGGCAGGTDLPSVTPGEPPATTGSQSGAQQGASSETLTPPTPRVPAPPAGQSCPTGMARCGEWCVDTKTDPDHCGFCKRHCDLGCAAGQCLKECQYYGDNVCGGDVALWCASGRCKACETGRQNCDNTGGCECETGCSGTRCNDQQCSRDQAFSCGTDPVKWCYHKDGYDNPGQCKTCSSGTHEKRFNCDGLGNNGCECVSKEIYEKGTGYTGRWTHECQQGKCVQIN